MVPLYAAGLAASALYLRGFPREGPAVQAAESRWGSLGDALLHVPRLPLYLAGVFLVGASTHAAWDFVPLRIAAGGGGPLLVGLGAGLSAFVEIPFMRSSGSLMDRFGPRIVFVSGAGVYVAASLAWAVMDAPLAVTVVRIAIGVGFGLTYVALVVMTGRLVPQRLRNTGQSLLQMCMQGLAPVVGGLMGGIVYQHLGPTQLFVGSAVGIVVGISVVWIATTRLPDAVTADPAG
jgi:PPP family 3-phenylpropionic acid transporter